MKAGESDAAIRPAELDDVGPVMRLWEEHGSGLTRISDDRAELERMVGSRRGSLIVAESGGELVGAVIAAFDGHRGHVHRLAVASPHRGRGVGGRLVDAAHQHLRESGARRVDVIAGADAAAADALWRSAGYERDPPELVRWARNL